MQISNTEVSPFCWKNGFVELLGSVIFFTFL